MYQGANEQRPAGVSATLYPTTKLLEGAVYHHKNHILSEDNWFTLPEQQEWCIQRGIHCNGTIKANRKNIPKQAIFKDTGAQKKARGEMQCMESTKNGNKFYFTSWMDSKPVHMLHTYPTMSHPIQRKTKDANGRFQMITIQQPTIIRNYNSGMGGTDLGDQRNSYYRFNHRTTMWPHRMYTQFIMVSITNAYILWKLHEPGRENTTQLEFMTKLMNQLAEFQNEAEIHAAPVEVPQVEEGSGSKFNRRTSTWQNDLSRLTGTHTLAKLEDSDDLKKCRTGCNVKSMFFCRECQAFLCIGGEGEQNCWWRFHNL